jgi:hypothetical protein
MKFFLFFISIFLTACATKQTHWEKYGASSQDFDIDAGQCRAQSFSIPNAPLMQVAIVYSSCMRGKGWNSVENEQ